jgi:hypothetical protein
MIQRIQTIYLLLITLITGLLIFVNPSFIEIQGYGLWTNNEVGFINLHFKTASWFIGDELVDTSALRLTTYTLAVICGMAFISIFLFKNRRLQILLTAFNYIFILVLYILMVYYGFKYSGQVDQEVQVDIAIGLFFPLFLPVFNYMALRRINYDEVLVRSTDRLR